MIVVSPLVLFGVWLLILPLGFLLSSTVEHLQEKGHYLISFSTVILSAVGIISLVYWSLEHVRLA